MFVICYISDCACSTCDTYRNVRVQRVSRIGLCVFNVCHVSDCACSTCVTYRNRLVECLQLYVLASWQCDIAETELLLFLLIASV